MAGHSGHITTISRPGGRYEIFLTCCSSTLVISKPTLKPRCVGLLSSAPSMSARTPGLLCSRRSDSTPCVLKRCHFDDPMAMVWKGGADSFFYKGDSGRWRGCWRPTILLSMRPPRRLSIRRFDCGSKAGAMQSGSECKDGSRSPPITGYTGDPPPGIGIRGNLLGCKPDQEVCGAVESHVRVSRPSRR